MELLAVIYIGKKLGVPRVPVPSLPNGITVLYMGLLWVDYYLVCLKIKEMQTTSNKRETFGEIINSGTPVLVDFFAEWCGPCKMMKPILEELHSRMKNKIRIIKIDIDTTPAVAHKFQVQSVPTLILFKNAKIIWRNTGVMQANQLEKIIEQNIINA